MCLETVMHGALCNIAKLLIHFCTSVQVITILGHSAFTGQCRKIIKLQNTLKLLST